MPEAYVRCITCEYCVHGVEEDGDKHRCFAKAPRPYPETLHHGDTVWPIIADPYQVACGEYKKVKH